MVERYRKTVYCELGFLQECFSDKVGEGHAPSSYVSRFKASIKKLLTGPDIKLFLDITTEEFQTLVKNIEMKLKFAKKGENAPLSDYEKLLREFAYKQNAEQAYTL